MHFLLPSFALLTVLSGIPLIIHLVGRSRAWCGKLAYRSLEAGSCLRAGAKYPALDLYVDFRVGLILSVGQARRFCVRPKERVVAKRYLRGRVNPYLVSNVKTPKAWFEEDY